MDEKNKILYEIKPDSMKNKKLNLIKQKYCEDWCKTNGFVYKIIGDEYFILNYEKIDTIGQPQLKKFKMRVEKWKK